MSKAVCAPCKVGRGTERAWNFQNDGKWEGDLPIHKSGRIGHAKSKNKYGLCQVLLVLHQSRVFRYNEFI